MIAFVVRVAVAVILSGSARAAETSYKFALVPQSVGNAFSDQARDGCKAAEKELKGAIECMYVGPENPGDVAQQVAIVQNLVTKRVDGIALAPSDPNALVPVLETARAAGIPIVTWDTDLNEKYWNLRVAHLGTNNFQVGVGIARQVRLAKPNGGSICIVLDAVTEAFDQRVQGIRDTLAEARSNEVEGRRLVGQNGWMEPDGCPISANNELSEAYRQVGEVLEKRPDLSALVMTGGLLQSDPKAYSYLFDRYQKRIASRALTVIGAGTTPVQIDLLRGGLSSGQVGRQPFEMGYRAMYLLKGVKDGGFSAPPETDNLGLNVCTGKDGIVCKQEIACPDREIVCTDNTCRPECK